LFGKGGLRAAFFRIVAGIGVADEPDRPAFSDLAIDGDVKVIGNIGPQFFRPPVGKLGFALRKALQVFQFAGDREAGFCPGCCVVHGDAHRHLLGHRQNRIVGTPLLAADHIRRCPCGRRHCRKRSKNDGGAPDLPYGHQ
jgi:hypothetical protein